MVKVQELLTEYLPIWTAAETERKSGRGRASNNSGSVYGIKKLRELILELAVRGQLVPQGTLHQTGNRKFSKLGDIVEVLDSLRKPVTKQDRIEGPYPYYGASGIVDFVSNYIFDEPLVLVGEDGAKWGAGENTAFSIEGKTWVNNHAHVIRPNRELVTDQYLIYCLNAMDLNEFITGMTVPKLNQARLISILIPLPPLAEQHRIVAKVDALMALCDQLENQHGNAADAHETLVAELLGTLTRAQDAAEFQAGWQRIAAHFDLLFTTDASIDALKQNILQLAVMGKLVPQDPQDEPASELMKRIQAEKDRLVADGKIRKEKPLAPIGESEKPFALPQRWEWVRLANIGITATGGTPKTSNTKCFGGDIPFIGPGQMMTNGMIQKAEKHLTDEGAKQSAIAEVGDILMVCIGGSIGKTVIAANKIAFNQQINCVKPLLINSVYLSCMLRTHIFQFSVLKNSSGSATPIINRSKWDELLVSLPPVSEQRRIVAKVDVLIALCDQLQARLAAARLQQQLLADALVAQAVKPSAEIIDVVSYRNTVACYALKKMQGKPYFGRTAAMKALYLAEAHLGLPLKFQPMREAAGPLDKWIYSFEKQGEQQDWFKVVETSIGNGATKMEYQVKPAMVQQSKQMERICSDDQRKEFDRLLGLLADKKTEEVEMIATVFAAWNDFLIDEQMPSDDQIVKDVRENWHERKARFTPDQLKKCLEWLRFNHIIPQGRSPHTVYQQSLITN